MNLTPKQTIKGTVAEAQSLKGAMKDIPSVDNTLTKEGYAADAKAVGEALKTKAPISHTEDKGNPHGVTASQVGARPDTWMPSASEIGARPDTWTPTAEEVGARPNTWMPTAEDVGARPNTWTPTAEQVGAATRDDVKKANPVNLLDNSDFRNPVNQRGETAKGSDGYWIDRWVCSNGVYADIHDGYIGLNSVGRDRGGFTQMIENYSLYEGKKLTFAICAKSDGGKLRLSVPYVGETNIIQLNNNWEIHVFTTTFQSNEMNGVGIYVEIGSLIHVKWAALYEGEYTAETLPEYHPKGYAHELAECQRYYCKFGKHSDPCWLVAVSGSFAVGAINFPVEMRTTPTLYNVQCLDLSSVSVGAVDPVCSEKGISHIVGGFTVGNGYRLMFEASADI